jgi:hypothetical protein
MWDVTSVLLNLSGRRVPTGEPRVRLLLTVALDWHTVPLQSALPPRTEAGNPAYQ